MYHWGKINFTDTQIETDLLLYRERASLLIPDYGEENRFVVVSRNENVSFLIGSTSPGQYDLLKSFFQRIYPCKVRKSEPPMHVVGGHIILNSRRNGKRRDFFYPSFLRNVINISTMLNGITVQYQVIIRSRAFLHRKRYSFALAIGYLGDAEASGAFSQAVRGELDRLRRRFSWKMKLRRRDSRLSQFTFEDPFALSTFVHVPVSEE